MARHLVLDEQKRREILAILSVGGSRATAARYVGCSPYTIDNTARRDPEFAAQLRRTEQRVEVEYLKNIQQAARLERYWRAAAWALERRMPTEYGARPPDTLSWEELEPILEHFAAMVSEALGSDRNHHDFLKRFQRMLVELRGPQASRGDVHELESSSDA